MIPPAHIKVFANARSRSAGGFSLLEMAIVLAILGIVTAIAAPRYNESLARYRADAAARRVIADLDHARRHARSSSAAVVVMFDAVQDTVTLSGVSDPDNPSNGWVTRLSVDPYYADLVQAKFGESAKLEYDGYGDVVAGGKIYLVVGAEVRGIVVDPATGKAVVQ